LQPVAPDGRLDSITGMAPALPSLAGVSQADR